jgi:hypothetical protein
MGQRGGTLDRPFFIPSFGTHGFRASPIFPGRVRSGDKMSKMRTIPKGSTWTL